MKIYLVTGGAGFIGSNYIHYLFEKYDNNIKVINVDKLTYAGNLENLKGIDQRDNYIFKKVDICDERAIRDIFENYDIDYVVNFAAESHVDRSIKDPEVFVKTNVLGTQILLNNAKIAWQTDKGFKEGKKYLQVSTDEVYGTLGKVGFFTESTPLDPHSPYSASKAGADMLVKAYFDTFGFPANITRCSNNYGDYQFPEKLIPLMINNAINYKKLPIYGDGKQIRDWLYVKDHNKAIEIVLKNAKYGEIYNIGGHNEKENIYIVKTIIKVLNETLKDNNISEELIKYVEDRLGHDRRYAIDPTKIKKDLGWEPEVMFDEGIVYTIKWYLSNKEWLENLTSGDYQKYYNSMYKTEA
jgi:dTDP-glucose 4,6-dehydratase